MHERQFAGRTAKRKGRIRQIVGIRNHACAGEAGRNGLPPPQAHRNVALRRSHRQFHSEEATVKRVPVQRIVFGLLILLLTTTTPAQRSFTSTYDSTRKVTLEGPVTKVDWVNPRAFFFMNVRDANGNVFNWAVEFGSAVDLEKNGWKASALKIGDVVIDRRRFGARRNEAGVRNFCHLEGNRQEAVCTTIPAGCERRRAGSPLAQ